MKTFNYSIIIPHYNIPNLLQRCLDSIPVRDDVQVIVVDDHSDCQVVDFQHFPKYNGGGYEIYFSPKNLGCGGARNAALPLVKGKWITCLDADDLLTNDADKIFDKYADSDADVIRFGMERRDCESLNLCSENSWYTKTMNDTKYPVIYKLLNCTETWGVFINFMLIKQYGIKWDEIRCHEDTMFNVKAALLAKNVEVHPEDVFYVYTSREGSLVNTISKSSILLHFKTDKNRFDLVKKAGLINQLSNYQLEHLHGFKRLTITEQLPLLWQMLTCGMLFHRSKYDPISYKLILNQLAHAVWKGVKNTLKK